MTLIHLEQKDGEWPGWARERIENNIFAGWLRGLSSLDPFTKTQLTEMATLLLDALSGNEVPVNRGTSS